MNREWRWWAARIGGRRVNRAKGHALIVWAWWCSAVRRLDYADEAGLFWRGFDRIADFGTRE